MSKTVWLIFRAFPWEAPELCGVFAKRPTVSDLLPVGVPHAVAVELMEIPPEDLAYETGSRGRMYWYLEEVPLL